MGLSACGTAAERQVVVVVVWLVSCCRAGGAETSHVNGDFICTVYGCCGEDRARSERGRGEHAGVCVFVDGNIRLSHGTRGNIKARE
jgi:hypothetical protein